MTTTAICDACGYRWLTDTTEEADWLLDSHDCDQEAHA